MLIVSYFDYKRLYRLINEYSLDVAGHDKLLLNQLHQQLDKAEVVLAEEIPEDVVTMYTKVQFTCSSDQHTSKYEYTLVLPGEADLEKCKISILAPIATAMLGHSVGESFECCIPSGQVTLNVNEIIYQPIAEGLTYV
ncbi:MAG TPA: GreA/GreB family elongation factor [Clostridia bacterium]|nr:GreA/GreB family elongation factor [Clostridia bacterium]